MVTRSPSWKAISVLIAALVGSVAVAVILMPAPDTSTKAGAEKDSASDKPVSAIASSRVVIGGVERPSSDVRLSPPETTSPQKTVKKRQGFSPAVDPNANASVTQLVSELKTRQNPSSFSSFAPPEQFDVESYKADPEPYLAKIEPGRVFAPAQPGDGVPPIRSEGKRFHRLKQGESVRLRVAVPSGYPVTFASQDLGQFDNQLSSITVAAGDDGIAEAVYTASGGTIDLVQILAASPMASGQVKFTVDVAVR